MHARNIPEENTYVQLVKTLESLQIKPTQLMRTFGITHQQYNVLRILQVRGESGLCPSQITPHMINRVPDMTRLLDRLERDGLISRKRCSEDRRKVMVYLSEKSKKLCSELDSPLMETMQHIFSSLTSDEKDTLFHLLKKLETSQLPSK